MENAKITTPTVLVNQTVKGNLTVTGEDISLRGVTVEGELTVEGAVNFLAAECRVLGGVRVSGGRNIAFYRNKLGHLTATGNRDLYLIDNEMEEASLSENRFIIADGNRAAGGEATRVSGEGNFGKNGDNLTDVEARLPVGADERLLPHVDKDQFIGLARKSAVTDGEVYPDLYTYIKKKAEESAFVYVAPGAYRVDAGLRLYAAASHTTVYAYGVYAELPDFTEEHIHMEEAEDLAIKGLTVGYVRPSCGQVYVLEKLGEGRARAATAAGMLTDFGKTNPALHNATGIGFQKAGTFYSITDTNFKTVEKESEDGMMLFTFPLDTYALLAPGDILTCKNVTGESSVHTRFCANVLFKDVTVYGNAHGACFVEYGNKTALTYYRVADTTRAGEVIDEKTYARYRALEEKYGVSFEMSRDEWGNYRGSPAHIGSIDATHVNRSARGSQVICSLFENMCDDGTNQKSNHARLHAARDNGDGTATLLYKANFSEAYKLIYGEGYAYNITCAAFAAGDRVYMYTAAGQIVCDAPALAPTREVGEFSSTCNGTTQKLYEVTVAADRFRFDIAAKYDLTDDGWAVDKKILVDNMSRSSSGFLFDNVLIQNVRSRALLVKSADGVIKNCTFRNIAKMAIGAIHEPFYGESGVTENLKIYNNLIDHTCFGLSNNGLYKHYPITVSGLGGRETSEEYMLQKNIEIVGNKFVNRTPLPARPAGDEDMHEYAIYLATVKGVLIADNDFGIVEGESEENPARAVRIEHAIGVEIRGNTYSPYTKKSDIVGGDTGLDIGGSDLG